LHLIQDWPALAKAAGYDPVGLARRCGVCRRQLERFFRRTKGTTVMNWLDTERLVLARDRLIEGCSVKEVAAGLGFSSPQQFSRKFKAGYGHPPGQPQMHASGRRKDESLSEGAQ